MAVYIMLHDYRALAEAFAAVTVPGQRNETVLRAWLTEGYVVWSYHKHAEHRLMNIKPTRHVVETMRLFVPFD